MPDSLENVSTVRSGGGAVVRLGWMMGGAVAIVAASMAIASQPAWTFGWRDAWLWTAVLVTVVLRYVDITRYEGQTANGAPATLRDFRRYVAGLLALVTSVWLGAQSVGL